MLFNYDYEINLEKLFKIAKLEYYKILDYGCGKGIWSNDHVEKDSKVQNIILYDNNADLINFLRKKYKNKKFEINFNLEEITNTKEYNIVIFSSVIQYISHEELKRTINKFNSNKKKITIIFTDVPFLPRLVEFVMMPLFNLKRFLFSLKLLFSQNYKNIKYSTYQKSFFDLFQNEFEISYSKNLHDLKYLRYTVVLSSK
tara:strand:+ start:7846 stop:8445 length:600 start_codon:yes stop_codon:yes gene_type:complete